MTMPIMAGNRQAKESPAAAIAKQPRGSSTAPLAAPSGALSRPYLLGRLPELGRPGSSAPVMRLLADYVGASHFLLARCDLMEDQGLDFILASDWPFDLARRLAADLSGDYLHSTELERCLALLSPRFLRLPDDVSLPPGIGRDYCMLSFCVGRRRFSLLLLFVEGIILSRERLREAGLFAAYGSSFADPADTGRIPDPDLTERELECLSWIAEGKTSEETAVILGISRNSINACMAGVMRKTATRTRSEAIAYAVRNSLV